MKIVFVLSLSLGRPGPSVHILTSLMRALAEAGHAVHVIEQRPEGTDADLPAALKGRVSVDAIPVPAQEKGAFAKRYLNQARYAVKTARCLRAHRDADVVYVHSCNTLALFAWLVRRIVKNGALVVNVQDIFPENAAMIGALKNGVLYRFMAAMQRYAYRRADAVITLSDDMKRTLVHAGAPDARVHVIPLWTYADDIRATPAKDNRFLAEHPELDGCFRAVYAGNVGAMQNVELVLEAAKLLRDEPDIRLVIVGDGAKKRQLETRAQEARLGNLLLYGIQPPERAIDVYSAADVNLITLAKGVIYTAFPSKTAPCMAVARPIIASVDLDSDYARMIEAIDGCFVTAPDDARALADAIVKARNLGASRELNGARAVYQGAMSERAGIARHMRLFSELSDGRGRS